MDTLMNERKRYVKNVILWQQVDNFHDQRLSYFEYTIIELIGVFKNSFSYKRAYICAQKTHIYSLQTSMWYMRSQKFAV